MVKTRCLIAGIIVLLAVPLAAEAGGMRVNWTFNGGFVQNLAKADDNANPTNVTGRASIIVAKAKGSPGSATLLGNNQSFIQGGVIPADEDCFAGADLKFIGGVSENSLVALFDDLSVLNIIKDNDAAEPSFGCFDIQTSRFDATVQIKFNGGFGRFENATGTGTIHLTSTPVGFIEIDDGDPPTLAPSKLLSEVGTITGTLYKN